MSDVTIFHNPNCGTSRRTLEILRDKGLKPNVVEYLKAGWTREQLRDLFGRMGVRAHDILRVRGTNAHELGLTDPAASDDAVIAAMVLDPVLVERPIVDAPKGVALCRPAERVLDLI
jgi:arsenate reductase